MEKKNSVDYFDWEVESTKQAGQKITATITGFAKRKCMPFSIKAFELEQDINNRMNNMEDSEYYKDIIARSTNRTNYTAIYKSHRNKNAIPEIKDVIFNPPATIVFWNDGTKTVVKCQNDEAFDPEKGITMAFFKKMHGNKGHYFEEIKKGTEKNGN